MCDRPRPSANFLSVRSNIESVTEKQTNKTNQQNTMAKPKKPTKKIVEITEPADLPKALKDVLGRMPKSVSFEFEVPKEGLPDDDGGWSGNVYKYNY